MSFQLFQAWRSSTGNRYSYIFLAQDSQIFATQDCFKPNGRYKRFIKPYRLRHLLALSFYALLRGSRLTVRIPHLNSYIIHDFLIRLHGLGWINLALYDDGFLGILETPSVLRHLKPCFNSLCCWDLSGWRPSAATMQRIQSPECKDFEILSVPLDPLEQAWMDKPLEQPVAKTLVVESKYMDYALLGASLIQGNLGLAADATPDYFLHPSIFKRNQGWPQGLPRNIIQSIPVEKHLVKTIDQETHLVAGMTSTVLILCELAKRTTLPRFRLTLLISDKDSDNPFYEKSEAADFCGFIDKVYGSVVDLNIVFNGQVQPLLKETKLAQRTGSRPPA